MLIQCSCAMRELRLYSDTITVSVGWSIPISVLTHKVNAEQSSAIITTLLSQLDSHMERFITPVGWGL